MKFTLMSVKNALSKLAAKATSNHGSAASTKKTGPVDYTEQVTHIKKAIESENYANRLTYTRDPLSSNPMQVSLKELNTSLVEIAESIISAVTDDIDPDSAIGLAIKEGAHYETVQARVKLLEKQVEKLNIALENAESNSEDEEAIKAELTKVKAKLATDKAILEKSFKGYAQALLGTQNPDSPFNSAMTMLAAQQGSYYDILFSQMDSDKTDYLVGDAYNHLHSQLMSDDHAVKIGLPAYTYDAEKTEVNNPLYEFIEAQYAINARYSGIRIGDMIEMLTHRVVTPLALHVLNKYDDDSAFLEHNKAKIINEFIIENDLIEKFDQTYKINEKFKALYEERDIELKKITAKTKDAVKIKNELYTSYAKLEEIMQNEYREHFDKEFEEKYSEKITNYIAEKQKKQLSGVVNQIENKVINVFVNQIINTYRKDLAKQLKPKLERLKGKIASTVISFSDKKDPKEFNKLLNLIRMYAAFLEHHQRMEFVETNEISLQDESSILGKVVYTSVDDIDNIPGIDDEHKALLKQISTIDKSISDALGDAYKQIVSQIETDLIYISSSLNGSRSVSSHGHDSSQLSSHLVNILLPQLIALHQYADIKGMAPHLNGKLENKTLLKSDSIDISDDPEILDYIMKYVKEQAINTIQTIKEKGFKTDVLTDIDKLKVLSSVFQYINNEFCQGNNIICEPSMNAQFVASITQKINMLNNEHDSITESITIYKYINGLKQNCILTSNQANTLFNALSKQIISDKNLKEINKRIGKDEGMKAALPSVQAYCGKRFGIEEKIVIDNKKTEFEIKQSINSACRSPISVVTLDATILSSDHPHIRKQTIDSIEANLKTHPFLTVVINEAQKSGISAILKNDLRSIQTLSEKHAALNTFIDQTINNKNQIPLSLSAFHDALKSHKSITFEKNDLQTILNHYAELYLDKLFSGDAHDDTDSLRRTSQLLSFFEGYDEKTISNYISGFENPTENAAFQLYNTLATYYSSNQNNSVEYATKYYSLMQRLSNPEYRKIGGIEKLKLLIKSTCSIVGHDDENDVLNNLNTLTLHIQSIVSDQKDFDPTIYATVLSDLQTIRPFCNNAFIPLLNASVCKVLNFMIDTVDINKKEEAEIILDRMRPVIDAYFNKVNALEPHHVQFVDLILNRPALDPIQWLGRNSTVLSKYFLQMNSENIPSLKPVFLKRNIELIVKHLLLQGTAEEKDAIQGILLHHFNALTATDQDTTTVLPAIQELMMNYFSNPDHRIYSQAQMDTFKLLLKSLTPLYKTNSVDEAYKGRLKEHISHISKVLTRLLESDVLVDFKNKNAIDIISTVLSSLPDAVVKTNGCYEALRPLRNHVTALKNIPSLEKDCTELETGYASMKPDVRAEVQLVVQKVAVDAGAGITKVANVVGAGVVGAASGVANVAVKFVDQTADLLGLPKPSVKTTPTADKFLEAFVKDAEHILKPKEGAAEAEEMILLIRDLKRLKSILKGEALSFTAFAGALEGVITDPKRLNSRKYLHHAFLPDHIEIVINQNVTPEKLMLLDMVSRLQAVVAIHLLSGFISQLDNVSQSIPLKVNAPNKHRYQKEWDESKAQAANMKEMLERLLAVNTLFYKDRSETEFKNFMKSNFLTRDLNSMPASASSSSRSHAGEASTQLPAFFNVIQKAVTDAAAEVGSVTNQVTSGIASTSKRVIYRVGGLFKDVSNSHSEHDIFKDLICESTQPLISLAKSNKQLITDMITALNQFLKQNIDGKVAPDKSLLHAVALKMQALVDDYFKSEGPGSYKNAVKGLKQEDVDDDTVLVSYEDEGDNNNDNNKRHSRKVTFFSRSTANLGSDDKEKNPGVTSNNNNNNNNNK